MADLSVGIGGAGNGAARHFLEMFEREHRTTLKVLRALPEVHAELKPGERSKSARELAWTFVMEQHLGEKALTTGFDWSAPPSGAPTAPATLGEVIDAFDAANRRLVGLVRGMDEAALRETVQFPVGPGTMGDWARIDFLWMLLLDQVHHRGQFSVYLRVAGAKVPSIYGPSADEPWF